LQSSTTYLNFYRAARHWHISNYDISSHQALKKIHMSYYSNRTNVIEIDGVKYEKDYFTSIFERDDILKYLELEQWVYNSKSVLAFLENGSLEWNKLPFELGKIHINEFKSYYSFYFAIQYAKKIFHFLNLREYDLLAKLFSFDKYILPEDYRTAYVPLMSFFSKSNAIFKNSNKENFKESFAEANHWINKGWSKYFNEIPSHLDLHKQLISINLFKYAMNYDEKNNINQSLIILNELKKIEDLNPALKNLVNDMYNLAGEVATKKPTWLVVLITIIFLVKLISLIKG
jgi:hypothetical protein